LDRVKGLVHHALVGALLVLGVEACAPGGEVPGKGDKLVDVEVFTLDGKSTKLFDLVKDKVAVFKFGASWCEWCTRQFAEFDQIARRFPKEAVTIFDIDVAEDVRTVEAYRKRHNVASPTFLDPQARAAGRYNVEALPVVIVAGSDQTILYRGYYTRADTLSRAIAPAVKKLEEERKKK